jgi:hypothetical protein
MCHAACTASWLLLILHVGVCAHAVAHTEAELLEDRPVRLPTSVVLVQRFTSSATSSPCFTSSTSLVSALLQLPAHCPCGGWLHKQALVVAGGVDFSVPLQALPPRAPQCISAFPSCVPQVPRDYRVPPRSIRPAFEATFCPPRAHSFARNRLEPKPPWLPAAPFRGDLALNGAHPRAHPRAHPAVSKHQDLVFGALTEVTAGGSSAPITWWGGANRQAAPGRPHGGGRILLTCTFLRLGGRVAGWYQAVVRRLHPKLARLLGASSPTGNRTATKEQEGKCSRAAAGWLVAGWQLTREPHLPAPGGRGQVCCASRVAEWLIPGACRSSPTTQSSVAGCCWCQANWEPHRHQEARREVRPGRCWLAAGWLAIDKRTAPSCSWRRPPGAGGSWRPGAGLLLRGLLSGTMPSFVAYTQSSVAGWCQANWEPHRRRPPSHQEAPREDGSSAAGPLLVGWQNSRCGRAAGAAAARSGPRFVPRFLALLAGYENLTAPLFALALQCKAEVTVAAPVGSL